MKTMTILSFVIACMCIVSCSKDEDSNNPPSSAPLTSPSRNSTIVGLKTDLSWEASTDIDGDKIKYDVYLGTDSDPSIAVITNNEYTSFNANNLTNNSTYYWKVVSKDENGEIESSEIWSFNTNAILGNWKSDTIVHPQYGVRFVQSHTFNADGTGTIKQTGELTNSFSLTWSVAETTLLFDLIGAEFKDTVYHTFENSGNTMIFKESEITPDLEAIFNRIEE